ncbi:MAG: hypothetical protein LBN38_05440 [Verrucomicrobiota bacterium]|jgi:hypothetical protein|nr:hypothetical protein [Verrucomicrobiota bacterium]
MERADYFEQRCNMVEMFYGDIVDGTYTVGQAAGRCLEAFQGSGRNELVTLSIVLALIARREPDALARFSGDVERLAALAKNVPQMQMNAVVRDWLMEDLRRVLGKKRPSA